MNAMPRALRARRGTTHFALLLALLFLVTSRPTRLGAAGPDYFQYQVPFPGPVANGIIAIDGFDDRAVPALTAVACRSEFDYLKWAREKKSDEDMTDLVIGKMDWFGGHHNAQGVAQIHDTTCRGSRTLFRPPEIDSVQWAALRGNDVAPINALFVAQFGVRCGASFDRNGSPIKGVIDSAQALDPNSGGAVTVNFTVTRSCMWDQINAAVSQMSVVGQMGTDGLRCMQVGSKRHGDWDMSLRNLTRIIYLDLRYHHDILRSDVRDHVRHNLLTADGPPADETYSLLGCGNTEESTGSAHDRADERNWVEDLFDDLGEFFSSLLEHPADHPRHRLDHRGDFLPAGRLSRGARRRCGGWRHRQPRRSSVTVNIPETENHLFMINSSKYLNNQLIIDDLKTAGDDDDAQMYEDDQDDLEEWFLERLQDALSEEFIEYNSRPYARLTIGALYNLVDFARDDDLKLSAQMALDFTLTKSFVGSHDSRRFVPFRRKRVAVRTTMIDPVDATKPTGLFDQVELADALISFTLLYAGQTQQLPSGGTGINNVSFGAARTMLPAITSFYRPEKFLVDLAINKQNLYQRFSYDSAEIYSSGPGFLISAGGITSGLAYSGSGIEAVDLMVRSDGEDDYGTAVPTTIFLSGANGRTTLDSQIRIEGLQQDSGDGGKLRTFDHNLCVWNGFACGLNIVIPPALDAPSCAKAAPPPAQTEWRFIDTADCSVFTGGPRRFVVIYRQACRGTGTGCRTYFGFVDVVEAGNETLAAFIARTIASNPPGFITSIAVGGGGSTGLPMSGLYHSSRNQDISFSADAHQDDSDEWGIRSVNGIATADLDDWDFAEGDSLSGAAAVFSADGDGRVVMVNPATKQTLEIDLSDTDDPKRKVS